MSFDNLKLRTFKGNLDEYVKVNPAARAYFSLTASKMKTPEGRYLLHYACERKLPWNYMVDIGKAYKPAIVCPDEDVQSGMVGLMPFMMTSIGDEYDLSYTYVFLRVRPDAIKMI